MIPKTLGRYITSEFLLSYFVSFLFYFLAFFFNQLLLMAQDILQKGIPLGSVLLLMLYAMPSFITLSSPFATLTAALMTYGRFSSDNEILAMRSAGLRRIRIFRPVLIAGIIIGVLSFMVNDILLPAGTRAFQELYLKLTLTHPGLELETYSVRTYRQSVLVTGDIDGEGIHPMMIIERDDNGNRIIILSALASPEVRGHVGDFPGFRMHDVFSLIPDAQNRDRWTWSRADFMDYRLLTDDSALMNRQPGPNNMRVMAIWEVIKEKTAQFDQEFDVFNRQYQENQLRLALQYASLNSRYQQNRDTVTRLADEAANLEQSRPVDYSLQNLKIEFFQKFAIPFACLPFVVLAFPLGVSAKRNGRAVGFFIGMLLAVLYWALLVLGRSLGLRAYISPFLVMVVPDLLLLLAGLILYFRRSRV